MRQNKKKLIGMSLLLIGLIGCGGGSSTTGSNSSSSSEASSSSESSQLTSVSSSSESSATTSSASSSSSDMSASSSSSSSGSALEELKLPLFTDLNRIQWSGNVGPEDIHFNDYIIVRSDEAVTVSGKAMLKAKNLNSQMYGRYVMVGQTDEEFPFERKGLVQFEIKDVVDALQAKFPTETLEDILNKVTSVSLAVWVENGELGNIALNATSIFNENSVTWNSQPNAYLLLSTTAANGSPGWMQMEIPISYLKDRLTGTHSNDSSAASAVSRAVYTDTQVQVPTYDVPVDLLDIKSYLSFSMTRGSENDVRSYVILSSDETHRAPALVITYESDALPEKGILEALGSEDDAQRASLSVNYSPQHPKLGDSVHVNVTATDDEGVDYIAVLDRDEVIAYKQASGDNVHSLTLSYDDTADGALLARIVVADDKGGLAGKVFDSIYQPVKGDGKDPTLNTYLQYEIPEVYPRSYRFIKNDGQQVLLHIHAEDADGLRSMMVGIGGEHYIYDLGGQASVDKVIVWTNDQQVSVGTFSYSVSVTDMEGRVSESTTAQENNLPIRDWNDLRLYKNALLFKNTSIDYKLTFSPYMNYIFSHGETHYCDDCLPTLTAWATYKWGVDDVGKGGLCYGMSTTSIALAYGGVLLPSELKPGAQSKDLAYGDEWTNKYLLTAQGSQISDEVFEKVVDYAVHHRHKRRWVLHRVIDGLENGGDAGKYGILTLIKGSMYADEVVAHAVVPWMVRKISNSEWRIYIYDSNKPYGPQMVQRQQTLPDLSNEDDFPYVKIDYTNNHWEYQMANNAQDAAGDGDLWRDGDLNYIPFGDVRGDSGQYNTLNSATNLVINDHDLPGLNGLWNGVFGYSAVSTSDDGIDLNIVDADGKASGYVKGELVINSSKVIPVTLADAFNRTHEIFLIKNGEQFTINVNGLKSSEYNLSILSGQTQTLIAGKKIENGKADRVVISPDTEAHDHFAVKLISSVADNEFKMEKVYRYGVIQENEAKPVERVFEMNDLSSAVGSVLDVKLNAKADTLIINSEKTNLDFNLLIRQFDIKTNQFQILKDEPVHIQVNKPFDLTHL